MSDGPAPSASTLVGDALAIVEAGSATKIPLRIFGAAAIFHHCPKYSYIFEKTGRRLGDIDLASYSKYSSPIARLMEGLGYEEDMTVSAFGVGRLIFKRKTDALHCDIFLGKLEMSHTISFERRLELDYPTVPLADLLLAKLQIFKLNEKDMVDTVVLLREHEVGGEGAPETVDSRYVLELCSKEWGLWRTVTGNLRKVMAYLEGNGSLLEADKSDVQGKVKLLIDELDAVPKTLSWKMRARVGESRKWYTEVEDAYR